MRRLGWRLGAILLVVGVLTGCQEPGPPPKRHALLIVIDTLRRDALDRARTPGIDALASRGELAPLAWSSDTWTGGSVVSLFTGRHVRDHGWIQSFPGRKASAWEPMPVLPSVPLLAEVFRDAGFDTAGIYANHVLSWDLGWDRGFDRWSFVEDADIPGKVAPELMAWGDGRRHFLYVHFLGPHSPIDPSYQARKRWKLGREVYGARRTEDVSDPEARARSVEQLRRAYWAAVEDTDAHIGMILRFLGPHLDDTAIVLTSDHGEQLGEHEDFGHGGHAYEALTRVPFIAVNTGPLPERLNNAVTADLLTRAVGVEHDWSLTAELPELLVAQYREYLALSRDGKAKATWDREGRMEVFDLAGYPDEQPGFGEQRESLADARDRFEEDVEQGETASSRVAADPEMLEALRALGYVGDGPRGE